MNTATLAQDIRKGAGPDAEVTVATGDHWVSVIITRGTITQRALEHIVIGHVMLTIFNIINPAHVPAPVSGLWHARRDGDRLIAVCRW